MKVSSLQPTLDVLLSLLLHNYYLYHHKSPTQVLLLNLSTTISPLSLSFFLLLLISHLFSFPSPQVQDVVLCTYCTQQMVSVRSTWLHVGLIMSLLCFFFCLLFFWAIPKILTYYASSICPLCSLNVFVLMLWTFLLGKVHITEITHRIDRNMHTITHTAQKQCDNCLFWNIWTLIPTTDRAKKIISWGLLGGRATWLGHACSTVHMLVCMQINNSCISSDYSGINLYAFMCLLCSKLCQHNRRRPKFTCDKSWLFSLWFTLMLSYPSKHWWQC